LRTGAFKLFKCTFPGSKQFKSTFILCFFKIYNKFVNYFCELKFSGNTQQNPSFYEGWNFNSGNYLFTTDTK